MIFMVILMIFLAPGVWDFDDACHDYEEHGVNDDWQVLLLPFSDDNICTMSCILLRLVAIDVTTTSFCIFHILLFSFVDKPNSILFQQSTLPALPSRSSTSTSSFLQKDFFAAQAALYLPWSLT